MVNDASAPLLRRSTAVWLPRSPKHSPGDPKPVDGPPRSPKSSFGGNVKTKPLFRLGTPFVEPQNEDGVLSRSLFLSRVCVGNHRTNANNKSNNNNDNIKKEVIYTCSAL